VGVLWNSRLSGAQSASYILGSIEIFPEHSLKWKVRFVESGRYRPESFVPWSLVFLFFQW
jgi:hypothetical protein